MCVISITSREGVEAVDVVGYVAAYAVADHVEQEWSETGALESASFDRAGIREGVTYLNTLCMARQVAPVPACGDLELFQTVEKWRKVHDIETSTEVNSG